MLYLMFFITDEYENCGQLCSQPRDRAAAWILMVLSICRILPIQLNIWSFYFIPRKFHTAIYDNDDSDLINPGGIESPLLKGQDNLLVIDEDVWNLRRDINGSEHS